MKEFFVGMRKFAMALIFLAVAIILLVTGVIPKEDWLDNVKDVMVAFMATNIGEHLISVGKDWIKEKKWFGNASSISEK